MYETYIIKFPYLCNQMEIECDMRKVPGSIPAATFSFFHRYN